MIVGDEHIAVISAEGRLPVELDREALFVVPAAFERLRLVAMRGARGALPIRGQISGPLSNLDQAVRNAVVEGDERFFTVIDRSALEEAIKAITDQAALKGVRLNRLASEYAAAAAVYQATIWFGHDRNVPRAIRDGLVPGSVRWRLLSQLSSWTPREI